jgi:hypothetical protein
VISFSRLAGVLAAAVALFLPSPAHAQNDYLPGREPIGIFAADLRVAFPPYPQDVATADQLGVTPANLPGRGTGLVFGAHVYPARLGATTVGIGGEIMLSRGRETLTPEEEGGPEGPTVRTRLSSVSPVVSLNFGRRQGWSYLSAGLGFARFGSIVEDPSSAAEDPPRRRSLHYGGGARWFFNEHVAFAIDLRFYQLGAQDAAPGHPAQDAIRRMVFSAGLAFK